MLVLIGLVSLVATSQLAVALGIAGNSLAARTAARMISPRNSAFIATPRRGSGNVASAPT